VSLLKKAKHSPVGSNNVAGSKSPFWELGQMKAQFVGSKNHHVSSNARNGAPLQWVWASPVEVPASQKWRPVSC